MKFNAVSRRAPGAVFLRAQSQRRLRPGRRLAAPDTATVASLMVKSPRRRGPLRPQSDRGLRDSAGRPESLAVTTALRDLPEGR